MPDATPFSPSLSSASEIAHVSSCASRAITLSMGLFPVASSLFPKTALPPGPYPLPPSLPVCKAHCIAGARFRAVTGDVIDLMVFQADRVHRRDQGDPVLDLGSADLEIALGQFGQAVLVAALHRRDHFLI